MSVNRVILVGNLGADPEVRQAGGQSVCDLRLATSESFKGKDGEREKRTEWHRVTVWGRDAENCGKYLAKGATVYVEGRLQTRSYEKDGVKRFVTDVIAERVVFLNGGKSGAGPAVEAERKRAGWGEGASPGANHANDGDDIPL